MSTPTKFVGATPHAFQIKEAEQMRKKFATTWPESERYLQEMQEAMLKKQSEMMLGNSVPAPEPQPRYLRAGDVELHVDVRPDGQVRWVLPSKENQKVTWCVACGTSDATVLSHRNKPCGRRLIEIYGSFDKAKEEYLKARTAHFDLSWVDNTNAQRQQEKVNNFPNGPYAVSDAVVRGNQIHKKLEEAMKTKCAVCPNPINHSNPHAVFCSSSCADMAAQAYKLTAKLPLEKMPESVQEAVRANKKAFERELQHEITKIFNQQGMIPVGGTDSYEIYQEADKTLRFLCGLNLQDHSMKEQREARDLVAALQKALRPQKAGK